MSAGNVRVTIRAVQRRRPMWTAENEEQLQQALTDGDERSMRTWKGKSYGAIA